MNTTTFNTSGNDFEIDLDHDLEIRTVEVDCYICDEGFEAVVLGNHDKPLRVCEGCQTPTVEMDINGPPFVGVSMDPLMEYGPHGEGAYDRP